LIEFVKYSKGTSRNAS